MQETRVSDLAILLGHALQCEACRERLLAAPDRVLVGRKISTEQRGQVVKLRAEDFESTAALAAAVGMPLAELVEGQNHPRARLRHL